ncbi:MAG: hypothetical protein JST89_12050 [Cyanobacteria bacterium SZAS-4]|nr:hypothetical protein [Cyanobacteria bacterium SZAS-4]
MNSRKQGQRKGRGRGPADNDQFIDATPDADSSPNMRGGSPRNLQETKVYKDSVKGARAAWQNYVAFLATKFHDTPRRGQEQFIVRMSQTLTIGSAVLITSLFYPFLPTLIRVFALPGVLVLSWWLGTKIVAPQMTIRFEKHLNQEF